MSKQTNMTTGNPTKLLLSFAIPLMFGTILQQSFIIVDRIIVGHLIGANAFASVGATGSVSMVFTSLCLGIAIGSGIVVSQFFGANDEAGTALAIRNGTMISIVSTLIISAFALLITRPLLILLNTPVSLLEDAVNYMSVSLGGLIFVIIYYIPFSILRSLGDAKTPIIFLATCSILNIVFDLVFILIFHTGVEGTAIASLLAQGIAGILCFAYAIKKYSYFQKAIKEAKFDRSIARQILKICIPMGFQYSLIYLSSSILQWVWNKRNRGICSNKPNRKLNPTAFYGIRYGDCNLYRTKYRGRQNRTDKARTDFRIKNMRFLFSHSTFGFLGIWKIGNEYVCI